MLATSPATSVNIPSAIGGAKTALEMRRKTVASTMAHIVQVSRLRATGLRMAEKTCSRSPGYGVWLPNSHWTSEHAAGFMALGPLDFGARASGSAICCRRPAVQQCRLPPRLHRLMMSPYTPSGRHLRVRSGAAHETAPDETATPVLER